eukprot:CAMPEP_0179003454 /NCGR_PEP_ID=MMETSP0795-20121207/12696_1 /TAXON_ID=88552 /ORGANISM="Amoebophrya sp., Strain Ameob2" /LENGTH=436 /DNA_ID=CAMNT_0020697483 /DNA_START=108 /DNA_END=1418 /DNA_ORIENTATION=+
MPMRLSSTTAGATAPAGMQLMGTTSGAGASSAGGQMLTSLYDRQYITLHNLLEREMRQRVESEKMIRDDMTSMQEGLARICNQIHEVATDLRGNLPRLYQECKELRQDCKQLTIAFNQHSAELAKVNETIDGNRHESNARFERNEAKAEERTLYDRQEKTDMWNKLCTKQVVQELADKVGCMDMESHAKFLERRQEYEEAIGQVKSMEEKVQKSLEEFLRGINKCDYLYSQCNQSNQEFQKACNEVTDQHRGMIDDVVFPRIERCEALLNQEMCERVDCLKKIAHELVHSKEQNDRVKDQVERLAVDLSTSQAARMANPTAVGQGGYSSGQGAGIGSPQQMMADGRYNTTSAWAPGDLNSSTGYTSQAMMGASPKGAVGGGGGLMTPRLAMPQLIGSAGTQNQMGAGGQGGVLIGGRMYPAGTRIVERTTGAPMGV